MTTVQSNEDFFRVLRGMIDTWCDERRFHFLALILPAYVGFNGLTDGWGELRAGLNALRASGPDAFNEMEWQTLGDLIQAADRAIDRR
jgi:hypothetical protein